MSAPHLCMVALNSYAVLSGRSDVREVGGAEVQQVMIARALVRAGARVTFVCMDFGQAAEESIDGIRVVRSFAPRAGLRGLRFFHPRWTGLRSALGRADAPIYYQRCAGMATGLVAHWCAQAQRGFIYAGASDLDFHSGPPNVRLARDRWLFRRGLRAADAVVVQNPRQQVALYETYGRDGVLIPSCYAPPSTLAAPGGGDEVLWVGMIRRVKRPDRFLALARALPQWRFRMIGGALGDSGPALAYYREIEAQARVLPNVSFMGFLPFAEAERWFDHAAVLVNTSEHEGFPNTFLQAWSRGVPTLATFDTGSRLDGEPPYRLAADDAELQQRLREMLERPALRQEQGQRAQRYFELRHSPAAVARGYLELMERILRARGGPQ